MKLFPSAPSAQLELEAGHQVRVFQSETAEILESTGPSRSCRTVFILAFVFVGLLVVSFGVRMERVIRSVSGRIVTVEPTVVLGALDQSIIKTIDVSEGQQVHKGDLLATLDPTFTTADVGALKSQVANLDAQIARCKAELAQKPFDMAPSADPVASSFISAQRAYYLQRKAQFDAQVHSYNDQIAQYQSTIAKFQNDEARYGDRAKISQQIEQMRATLAAAQVGSRLNLLAATDQKLEMQRALEFDRNAVVETKHQLDATTATRDAFIQQWLGQTSQEMVTAQTTRAGAVEQLTKATKHYDLVRVEAPEDSVVLKIAKLSPLSVINPPDPLISLAPMTSPFEAEMHVLVRDVGYIRVGDDVTLKLDAYNYLDHGSVDGKIRSISEGSFTADETSTTPTPPYYKVFIRLMPITLRDVPASFRLVPGITLTGDIHIGSHSLFTYMFSGVVRGYGEPMRGVP